MSIANIISLSLPFLKSIGKVIKHFYFIFIEKIDVEKMKNNLLELFGQELNAGKDDKMAEFS